LIERFEDLKIKINKKSFTLIEVLVVTGIILILITISVPCVSVARNYAKKTVTKSQIHAMEVGMSAFLKDNYSYVYSNPAYYCTNHENPADIELDRWEVQGSNGFIQGANLLVDALVGRDLRGYDYKRPIDDTYNRWDLINDRRQPYIPLDSVNINKIGQIITDAFGGNPNSNQVQPVIDGLACRVFLDNFGGPILYYKANASAMPGKSNIIQSSSAYVGDWAYDGRDNEFFTSYLGTSPLNNHRISDASLSYVDDGNIPLGNRFAEFIRNTKIVNNSNYKSIPMNMNKFIIMSAGKDGIFGTVDDIVNFGF